MHHFCATGNYLDDIAFHASNIYMQDYDTGDCKKMLLLF